MNVSQSVKFNTLALINMITVRISDIDHFSREVAMFLLPPLIVLLLTNVVLAHTNCFYGRGNIPLKSKKKVGEETVL